MKQDEALEQWIENHLPDRPDFPVTSYRIAAREAWHAATKHTLLCITTALKQQAEVADEWQAKFMRELADMIAMEKP